MESANAKFSPLGPFAPFISAWTNRRLIVRLTRREIEARYRGSILGLLWSLLIPITMLVIYTFVFSVIFQARWEMPVGGRSHFALVLFCGLILFNLFAECLNRSPSLMLVHASYIKKVVFPLEILPWVTLAVALFNALISYLVLAAAYAVILGAPPVSVLYLPLIVAPVLLLSLGLTLFFASVGVFIRDLQQIMGVITMVLMFMSPLFYPVSAIPAEFRGCLQLSPLTVAIEESRSVLFAGEAPDFAAWSLYLLGSWLAAWLGYVWFMKTKKGFADVI